MAAVANDPLQTFIVTKARPVEPGIRQPPGAGIIPPLPARVLVIGPSGTGKTNLTRWLLDNHYRKPNGKSWFKEIHLLSPNAKLDWTWADFPDLPDKNRHSVPRASILRKIYRARVREILGTENDDLSKIDPKVLFRNKEKVEDICIIIDDSVAESIIKSKDFLRLFIRGRHFKITVFFLSQIYMGVPRWSRIQASDIMMFDSFMSEIEAVYEEHGTRHLSKNEFIEMVNECHVPTEADPYPFFYIARRSPLDSKYRRNLTTTCPIDPTRIAAKGGRGRTRRGEEEAELERMLARDDGGEEQEEEDEVDESGVARKKPKPRGKRKGAGGGGRTRKKRKNEE